MGLGFRNWVSGCYWYLELRYYGPQSKVRSFPPVGMYSSFQEVLHCLVKPPKKLSRESRLGCLGVWVRVIVWSPSGPLTRIQP